MTDDFLETEAALHDLLEELQRLKSTSEQLSAAGSNVAALVITMELLSQRTGEVAEAGRKQIEKIEGLTGDSMRNMDQLAKRQKEQTEAVTDLRAIFLKQLDATVAEVNELRTEVSKLSNEADSGIRQIVDGQQELEAYVDRVVVKDLTPAVQDVRRIGRSSRTILAILTILVAANLALTGYLLWVFP